MTQTHKKHTGERQRIRQGRLQGNGIAKKGKKNPYRMNEKKFPIGLVLFLNLVVAL